MKIKKVLTSLFLMINFGLIFGQSYQIKKVDYDITGCGWKVFGVTNPYALSLNVPVYTNKVFNSKEEYDAYIKDYKIRLKNTRAFDSFEVIETFKDTSDSEIKIEDLASLDADSLISVDLKLKAKDSFHLLVVPYPKYDSNNGLNMKLKMKDTNFLGSLNSLSSDFYFLLSSSDSDSNNEVGFNFDFDYPFKAGILDCTWVNDDSFYYTFGNDTPEWDAKTGLKLELPFNKWAVDFEIYQSIVKNFDYEVYDDTLYFTEEGKISVPVTLTKIKNFADLKYTPYLDVVYNWDHNGINELNTDLSGPTLTAGQTLSSSRTNWENNFRTGFSATIKNYYSWNFQRQMLYPTISLDAEIFKRFEITDWNINNWEFFNRLGICSRLYTFYDFTQENNEFTITDGTKIGGYLRGVRDEQLYKNSSYGKACLTTSAIILNLDLPFQVCKTNFSIDLINFDFQLNPFVDIALIHNKATGKWFNPKDGFYCAGLEALVYPKKWSSFTLRGSLGVDVGRYFFSDYIDTSWRDNVSKYEISIGIGLQY